MTPPLPERLRELAERCEQATGPSRQLDGRIQAAIGGPPYWELPTKGYPNVPAPPFTASLDAAMTLVPKGWSVAAICQRKPWFARLETDDYDCVTWGRGSDYRTDVLAGQDAKAVGATAALALTAAALCARAQSPLGDRE